MSSTVNKKYCKIICVFCEFSFLQFTLIIITNEKTWLKAVFCDKREIKIFTYKVRLRIIQIFVRLRDFKR